ncbi:hypothetical protein BIWAKO_00142 [Bosea sp. BIWAKO-01]|nr:hypothetical protein BIWAKO_00142 [Bosea sp. BIWAKO-01]
MLWADADPDKAPVPLSSFGARRFGSRPEPEPAPRAAEISACSA